MRLVFMGTQDFASASLKALLRSDDSVVGAVTQPDRPKGRGQILTPSPVKLLAQREQIPLLQPLKMKDPEFLRVLAGWKPDLIAVAAFGRILPPDRKSTRLNSSHSQISYAVFCLKKKKKKNEK